LSSTALLIADAGPDDGLGHLSRLSAVAVALRCRGVETSCHANGATAPLERDGVAWESWSPGHPLPSDVDVTVVDSYRLAPSSVVPSEVPFAVFDDHGDLRSAASLVVSVASPPSDNPPRLGGPKYAALRPAYWGLPPKNATGPLRRVLVTTGGGDPRGLGVELAQALRTQLPDTTVALVRGPHASAVPLDGIELLDAPESLLEEQLAADLVICGAGQTMLEAAACGTPCLALVLIENQRQQALRLESSGAVVLVEPADADGTRRAVRELGDRARQEQSRRAQQAVDGYGALRIAFHVKALIEPHVRDRERSAAR
jgi:spore coat polysaccharide biosynthesis predicted glycosyltransferase SpsG